MKFNESNVREEFDKEIGQGITKITLNNDWAEPYFEVYTEDNEEYMITENEETAEAIAISRVKQDLEEEPEIFNKGWLESMMNDVLENESFIDHASKEAVEADGFAHFLGTYDGDYTIMTNSGFVIMRLN